MRMWVALVVLCCARAALAADRVVEVKTQPDLADGFGALPRIVDPRDSAEAAINTALARLDAVARKAQGACRGVDRNTPGDWGRSVTTSMRGPGFLSIVIDDSYDCGLAHPEEDVMAIVYDLRTGATVDWSRLLPLRLTGALSLKKDFDGTRTVVLASQRLAELVLSRYRYAHADSPECLQAAKDAAALGPPKMSAWLDAKAKGLALQFSLPYTAESCADPVILSAGVLKAEGADVDLLNALATAPDD